MSITDYIDQKTEELKAKMEGEARERLAAGWVVWPERCSAPLVARYVARLSQVQECSSAKIYAAPVVRPWRRMRSFPISVLMSR